MHSKECSLFDDREYIAARSRSFCSILNGSTFGGIDPKLLFGVFEYLLTSQGTDGAWTDPDGKWTAVQTAVIVKTLANLGYSKDITWPLYHSSEGVRGGIEGALGFFRKNESDLRPEKIPNIFVEDLWDLCQVLLSISKYNEDQIANPLVKYLEANWLSAYSAATNRHKQDWAGPAFLSAVLEVFLAYKPNERQLHQNVLNEVMNIVRNPVPEDGFLWGKSVAEGCWHGSLVLRTICRLPDSLKSYKEKSVIIKQMVSWLLDDRKDRDGNETTGWGYRSSLPRDRPMYTARSLEALTYSLPYLDRVLVEQVRCAINSGNVELESQQKKEKNMPGIRIGTLKSTIAVAEYFAALTIDFPIQALIDGIGCVQRIMENCQPRVSKSQWVFNSQCVPVEGGLRIALLSDLHIGDVTKRQLRKLKTQPFFRELFQKQKSIYSEAFALINLEQILGRIAEIEVHHVLIAGDITMLALPEQFSLAREKFIGLQNRLRNRIHSTGNGLSPDFWTILPGNHDVECNSSQADKKLSLFFKSFGETYKTMHFNDVFPIQKTLASTAKNSQLKVEIIGLDSTANVSVDIVGLNALGQIRKDQFDRLSRILEDRSESSTLRIVVLHHHLVNIPYVKSEVEENFLQLNKNDANKLLNLSCDYGIHGILHGHFHVYSPWFAPIGAPDDITGFLPIVGAPCGTLSAPNKDVKFLELREMQRESSNGTKSVLQLYRHSLTSRQSGQQWTEESLGVCFG
jgi:hypothetical protein